VVRRGRRVEPERKRIRSRRPKTTSRVNDRGHFLGLIGAAVRDVTGAEREIRLQVQEQPEVVAAGAEPVDGIQPSLEPPRITRGEPGGMNPKYTSTRFVIGSLEPVRARGALPWRKRPHRRTTALHSTAGTGLGKTQLLQPGVASTSPSLRRALGQVRHERDLHERLHQLAADKRIEGFKQR